MKKAYWNGKYYHDTDNQEQIEQYSPAVFEVLCRKFGWIKKEKDESIYQRDTEKKSGSTGQGKRNIQQRSGQRIPSKSRKANK